MNSLISGDYIKVTVISDGQVKIGMGALEDVEKCREEVYMQIHEGD